MSALAAKIQADLVSAMKNREEIKLSVLRMLKSSMQLAQVAKKKGSELEEDEIIVLLRRLIKQRVEAAEMYRTGGANDRALTELEEAKYLEAYLPPQLSDSELDDIIAEAAIGVGATGMKDMGKVMGKAMAAVAARTDGNKVKNAVQKYLSSLSS